MYEIEKVNELCQDFADRYIETLKIKLNSDNIFKGEDEDDLNEMNNNPNDDNEDSELNSSHKSSSNSNSHNFNSGDTLDNENENKKQARSFKSKLKPKNSFPLSSASITPLERIR